MRERPVARVDDDTGQDGGGGHVRPQGADRLLEQVAELPLGHRAEHVERQPGHLVGRLQLLQRERAHLRPVAVGDEHIAAAGPQLEHGSGRDAGVLRLLLPGAALVLARDGVAAEGDDHPPCTRGAHELRIASQTARAGASVGLAHECGRLARKWIESPSCRV